MGKHICFICEKEIKDVKIIYKENYYCEDCFHKHYSFCQSCEDFFESDEMTCIDGEYYCANCEEELFFAHCPDCGERVKIDNCRFVYDGEYYCDRCGMDVFSFCEDCSDIILNDYSYSTHDGRIICEDCYQSYGFCETCEELYLYSDLRERNGSLFCEHCFAERMMESCIHEYVYKPEPIFHAFENEERIGDRKNNLHVGIELEIQGDNRDDFCSNMNNSYADEDKFYMKFDGSLDDDTGVEIVSHPMTLKYILNTNDWKNVFRCMNENSMDDTSGCGLHFHLDKEYLNNQTIQIIDFIVNNYSEYFSNIGGRSFNEISRFCKKTNKDKDEWGCNDYCRYTAVNLTNSNTVELRFCQSTDNYETFIKRLKMIFAIVEFAKKYTFEKVYEFNNSKFIEEFEKIFNNIYK